MKTIQRIVGLIAIFYFSSFSFTQQPTQIKTKYVFIVAIDGLRYDEGFAAGDRYIPFLWDSLAPKGTIFTNFYNTGVTTSNSGHSQITNGVRQVLLINTNSRNAIENVGDICPLELQYSEETELMNNLSPDNITIETDLRPTEPTIGEYFRKFTGAPAQKVYYINGHSQIWRNPLSLFPGYGPEFSPVIIPVRSDTETLDSAFKIIDRNHPTLAYVLFGAVDAAGHSGDTTKYLGQIKQVDSLIYQLWNKIQSDSIYANTTTMLITTDHGRHDEQSGGWRNHGDQCSGCRHAFLIAIGPDIKQNFVVESVHDHIDLAPTVGVLLNFPTPLSQGKPLSEMFLSNIVKNTQHIETSVNSNQIVNLSKTTGFSRSPSITMNSKGLHVVFSDNTFGKSDIYYLKSTNKGISWNNPQIILTDTDPLGYEMEPCITAVDTNSLYVVSSGYHYSLPVSTYLWLLKGVLSENSGESWTNAAILDTQLTISTKPTVSSSEKHITAISTVSHSLKSVLSIDGGHTFETPKIVDKFGFPQFPSSTYIKSNCYSVWQNVSWFNTYWNIWFSNQPWQFEMALNPNLNDSYSYYPSISNDNRKRLHTVYSYAYVADSLAPVQWRIDYIRSLDSGKTWQDFNTISGSNNSFMPKIKTSNNGKICAIWSSFISNQWSIWGTFSADAGLTWHSPFQITNPQEYSLYPDFSVLNDSLFIIWQNYKKGNWEIFFQKYVLPNSADTISLEKIIDQDFVYSLQQNYPNPFNPSTKIGFSVPNSTFVNLKVFNMLGQEVSTLIQGEIDKGYHEVEFNGLGLPNGVYIYRIEMDNFTDSKKLLLLK